VNHHYRKGARRELPRAATTCYGVVRCRESPRSAVGCARCGTTGARDAALSPGNRRDRARVIPGDRPTAGLDVVESTGIPSVNEVVESIRDQVVIATKWLAHRRQHSSVSTADQSGYVASRGDRRGANHEGKVRHFGLSEESSETTTDHRPAASTCCGHGGDLANPGRAGIGLVPFSPLGNGFLAGTVRSTTTFTDGMCATGSHGSPRRIRPRTQPSSSTSTDSVQGRHPGQAAPGRLLAQQTWIVPISRNPIAPPASRRTPAHGIS